MLCSTLRRVPLRCLSISAVHCPLPVAWKDIKLVLEKSAAYSESSHALAASDKMQQEYKTQDPQVLQQIALLVAKRGQSNEIIKAVHILWQLLTDVSFQADDTTQVAVIYTLDACLRRRRLENALLLFQAANNKDILVDLLITKALLKMLVRAHRVDEAVVLLKNVTTQRHVRPTEQMFHVVLVAMMRQRRYEDVVVLLEHGRANEVKFSFETYDQLVELSQKQYTVRNDKRLGKFMEYVNNALRLDGYWDEDNDDDDGGEYDDDDKHFDQDDEDFDEDCDEDFDDEFD